MFAYQALKTLRIFLKNINFTACYPAEQATGVMTQIIQTIVNLLLPSCDSTTIHNPVQMITYLVKIDVALSKNVISTLVVPHLLPLFDKYHMEAMLA